MNLQGGQMASAAGPVDEQLEQVLLGLADGSYVLSTPDGAIAECGVGVAGLLGAPADALVGQPTTDVLVAGADDASRSDFERLLIAPSVDPAATPTFAAQVAGGVVRSLRFVVVAVPLALGWEFTSLLSELRARDAGTWHPEGLRMRHGGALEAVEGVVRHGTQPDPNARLAGILVVVRDVDSPLLTREDVDRRMAEQRAAAREASAEAARRADAAAGRSAPESDAEPTDQGAGLDDILERARILRERVEEAEHEATTAQVARAAAEAAQAQTQAEARTAEAAADAARAEAEAANADIDRLRAELQAVREAVHDERAAHSEGAEAEIAGLHAANEAAHADADAARAELHAERAAIDAARGESALVRGEIAAVRAGLQSASGALEQSRRELEAVRAEGAAGARALQARDAELAAAVAELTTVRRELEARNRELAAAVAELTTVRRELDAGAAELDEARAELTRVRGELDATLATTADVRAEREQARLQAQQLLSEAEHARAAAEAIRAEFALDAIAASDAGQRALSERRARSSVPERTSAGPPPVPAPPRPALPTVGSGQAAALIGLDGSFKRLDEAFCLLLGCREQDLHAARWPSIIDRENLAAHKEIARALAAGEIRCAEIETVYMHAQGLLVPIAGTVSMHRAEPNGPPTHFLFRADVSRTAGR